MPHLHTRLASDIVRDPVYNGYTRRTRGLLVYRPSAESILLDHPSQVQRQPIGNGRTFNANVSGTMTISAGGGLQPKNAFVGIELGNTRLNQTNRGANGGWDYYVDGNFIVNVQDASSSALLKLAIYENGQGFGYINNALVSNLFSTPTGIAGTAYDYMAHSANPYPETVIGTYNSLVVCSSNYLLFSRCPANGFVVLTVGAEPPVTVNLDATGAGSFDCGPRAFPIDVTFDIQDSTHTSQAQFRFPKIYGGDVIGAR